MVDIQKKNLMMRLNRLKEFLEELKRLPIETYDEFMAKTLERSGAERLLQLAIECCIDIGNYIVARAGFKRPEGYKSTFDSLCREGIISSNIAEKMKDLVELRNQLVHIYWRVDTEKVFNVIKARLSEFEQFILQIIEYMEKL